MQALSIIEEARRVLAPGLAALLAESYTRSYKRMLTVMSLAELEEVVEFKRYKMFVSPSKFNHPPAKRIVTAN